MIRFISLTFCLLLSVELLGWGMTGHRTIGLIAEKHLTKKAQKNVHKILRGHTLAEVSTWMDDIRSDDRYDHTHDWHWVTIPDGQTYEESDKNPNGDLIRTIERLIGELKADTLGDDKKAEAVKMLVHLIGDIHQPLHVGNGEDKGGNDIKVEWFWEKSNLHRVWDSGMIDSQKYSYTELARIADDAGRDQVTKWQQASVRDWAEESMSYREQVYELPEDKEIGYEYRYKNWSLVELRLSQAGIRLAGVLNQLFG